MKIAAILNCTLETGIIIDTVESILFHMTDKILVISEKSFSYENTSWLEKIGVPYKDLTFGLQTAYELYPDYDWYCYLQDGCVINSDRFKSSLEIAEYYDIWMFGSNGHVDNRQIVTLNSIAGEDVTANSYYLSDSCQFYKGDFIRALAKDLNFFEKFFNITGNFSGNLPNYEGLNPAEHIYPTLARYLKKNIGVFSIWDQGIWHGSGKYFPIRHSPEITEDEFKDASILYPLKDYNNHLRTYFRKNRK